MLYSVVVHGVHLLSVWRFVFGLSSFWGVPSMTRVSVVAAFVLYSAEFAVEATQDSQGVREQLFCGFGRSVVRIVDFILKRCGQIRFAFGTHQKIL